MSKEIRETITNEVNNILDIFEKNIIKGFIIGELKREHITEFEGEKAKKSFQELCDMASIENIARSQSLVILVTSLETFLKDFFRIILSNRTDLLKKALRKIDEKWKSSDLVEILNGSSFADKIIEKANLNFQNLNSLHKAFDLIDISLSDEIFSAQVKTLEYFASLYSQANVQFNGNDLMSEVFENRHRIIHEGTIFDISDFELNVRMLFFQYLVLELVEKFSDSNFTVYERKFNLV
jgi:hypothetical protein